MQSLSSYRKKLQVFFSTLLLVGALVELFFGGATTIAFGGGWRSSPVVTHSGNGRKGDGGGGHSHSVKRHTDNATAWWGAGAFSQRRLQQEDDDVLGPAPSCLTLLPQEPYPRTVALPARQLCSAPHFAWTTWPLLPLGAGGHVDVTTAPETAEWVRAACSPAVALWSHGKAGSRVPTGAPLSAVNRAFLDGTGLLRYRHGGDVGPFVTVLFFSERREKRARVVLTLSDVEAIAAAQREEGILAVLDDRSRCGAEPRLEVRPDAPFALDFALPWERGAVADVLRGVLPAARAEAALVDAQLDARTRATRAEVFCGAEPNLVTRVDVKAATARRAKNAARVGELSAAAARSSATAYEGIDVMFVMPDSMSRSMMPLLMPRVSRLLRGLDVAGPAAANAHVTEFFRFNLAGCCTRSNLPPMLGGCKPSAAVMKRGTDEYGSIFAPCVDGQDWLPVLYGDVYGAETLHSAFRHEFNQGNPLGGAAAWSAVQRLWDDPLTLSNEVRGANCTPSATGAPPPGCPPMASVPVCADRLARECVVKFEPIPGERHRHCMSGTAGTDHLTQGVRQFWAANAGRPKYAFFHTAATHAESFAPHDAADEAIAGMVRDICLAAAAPRWDNNTVLLIVGDHGPNVGGRAASPWGKRERQLPVATVVLPTWLANVVPDVAPPDVPWADRAPAGNSRRRTIGEMLRVNEQRLTSGVDMYELVRWLPAVAARARGVRGDVLVDAEMSRTPREGTLVPILHTLPLNRTCANMGVHERFCSCSKWEPLDPVEAARYLPAVANFVNNMTARSMDVPADAAHVAGSPRSIGTCRRWSGSDLTVVDAHVALMQASKSFLDGEMITIGQNIMIHTSATPAALEDVDMPAVTFEALVTSNGKSTQVTDVLRISVYGGETCDRKDLEQLCVCMRS